MVYVKMLYWQLAKFSRWTTFTGKAAVLLGILLMAYPVSAGDQNADTTEQELPTPVSFETIDHGDWLELAAHCIPVDTQGFVEIPESIEGKPIKAIGDNAFSACEHLTKVVLPSGIESIGDYAFHGCGVKEIVIPPHVNNVGEFAFSTCYSLGDIRIEAPISDFGYGAFSYTGVTNLVIAAQLTAIDTHVFAGNEKLVSVMLPSSVTRVYAQAFDGNCILLKSAYVPNTAIIEEDAFPASCTIVRYGQETGFSGDRLPDLETQNALMQLISYCFEVPTLMDIRPAETPFICAQLGIPPSSRMVNGNDIMMYEMPSVECLDIDPESHTITGKVVVNDGKVMAMPFKRVFGVCRIIDGSDGAIQDIEDFEVDTSDYICSNGLFRITIPEAVFADDKSAYMFRIKLSDKKQGIW